ncbi:unnamed protein product [Cuscuta campestris]|uniref:Uncharacterized protein n=1 Tax=Cuscuta campestris TaxID=132261 RepID=A0A484NBE0_9ASTE|nr:unnamed protein product [Cuscuta campestris]
MITIHEAQSATGTTTNKARVEASATTIDNGRDAKAPDPADIAEDKAVLVEIEQICVAEDVLGNNQNPSDTDPNSRIEKTCEAHKLDANTFSLKKEMDGTLSPSINGDNETISDPTHSTNLSPPVTIAASYDPTTIGLVLHSFEVDGQHYEIRSYIEEGETSNQREETPNDFQDVQNKRSKRPGKRGIAPRTIKTRSYDPNLKVGAVSEITRYWPSRKSTTMEKIVTPKSYSVPFCPYEIVGGVFLSGVSGSTWQLRFGILILGFGHYFASMPTLDSRLLEASAF